MQYLSNSRRIVRALKPLALAEANVRFVSHSSHAVPNHRSPSAPVFTGMDIWSQLHAQSHITGLLMSRANFSSEAEHVQNPTEAIKELYDKILDSINVKVSMAPNAWFWSLLENCRNEDDISLVFDTLQKLRVFRGYKLRILENFNTHLCEQVTKTCVRVGAINQAKRSLWKHNIHGLTPTIAAAHHILSYALEHKDVKLMEEIMKLLQRNDLPLQPGTADFVFRICGETDNWGLLMKYSKKFGRAGVKFRKTTFDVWMEFSAKRGDTETLWNVEKLRSETYSRHTLFSAFSCAKGFLLEHKPEEAAAVIQITCQAYPDEKKNSVLEDEFKKLVNQWPEDVIKHQKEEDKKVIAASLKSDILAMVSALVNSGMRVSVDMDELNKNEALS